MTWPTAEVWALVSDLESLRKWEHSILTGITHNRRRINPHNCHIMQPFVEKQIDQLRLVRNRIAEIEAKK